MTGLTRADIFCTNMTNTEFQLEVLDLKRLDVYLRKLLKEIPLSFLERMLQAGEGAYGRANDTLVGEFSEEEFFVQPRGVVGSALMKDCFVAAAKAAGLKVVTRKVGKKKQPVPILAGKRILVALARSGSPTRCCSMSRYRKDLLTDNPLAVLPMAKYIGLQAKAERRSAGSITYFLLHGPMPKKPDRLGFLQFAVADRDGKNLLWRMSVKDLIDLAKQSIPTAPLPRTKQRLNAQGESSGRRLVSLRKPKKE